MECFCEDVEALVVMNPPMTHHNETEKGEPGSHHLWGIVPILKTQAKPETAALACRAQAATGSDMRMNLKAMSHFRQAKKH